MDKTEFCVTLCTQWKIEFSKYGKSKGIFTSLNFYIFVLSRTYLSRTFINKNEILLIYSPASLGLYHVKIGYE